MRQSAGFKATANEFILTHRSLNICQHYKLFNKFNLTTSKFSSIKHKSILKLQSFNSNFHFPTVSFTDKQALYFMSGVAIPRLLLNKTKSMYIM